MCKTLRTQNFRAPWLSRYSFGGIWRPIQPSHLKNHEFQSFTKLRTKPSSYAVVHRPTWPCAKPTELKTFVHQDFHGIHLGTFVGLSNRHISKITNFLFSQNSPPSHLVMSWCIDQLGQVQNPPNSKLSCTKTFMVFIWAHLEANPTITSQKPRIWIFHKTPHQAIYLCHGAPTNLAMCKTLRTQNFRAPWHSKYSLGGIRRPIQPSHLKNHEFQFFTKLPTKPSSYAWSTDQLGHMHNPPKSKLSHKKTFMVFIWGHLETFPTLTSQKSRISIFQKTPHQAI